MKQRWESEDEKMKKLFNSLCIALLLLIVFPIDIKADVGPKPSIVITFEDMGEPYYVTLLSKEKTMGPWSAFEGNADDINLSDADEKEAVTRFVEYAENDEYYFLNNYMECSKDNRFSWTYYPPKDFKLAIYLVKSGRLIVTDAYTTYAFDSYYRYDASSNKLIENYDHKMETVNLIVRVVLTIVIEVLIALAFGLKDHLKTIIITNVITQLLLNLFVNITNYYGGLLTVLLTVLFAELAVLIIEAVVYKIIIRKRAITYAIVANVVSFAAGMLLAFYIPGLF